MFKNKVPLIIVIMMIMTFIGFNNSINKEAPYIETVYGDINKLNNINITASDFDRSYYYYYDYVLYKEDRALSKYNKEKYNHRESYIDMIDTRSGQDDIVHIGIEDMDIGEVSKEYNLVIDIDKTNKDIVMNSQGNNNYIDGYLVNLDNVERVKYNIESNDYLRILSTYRYESQVYVFINVGDIRGEIISINPSDLSIKHINSIDFSNYIKNYNRFMNLYVNDAISKDNKFYITFHDIEELNASEELENLNVITYDIESMEKECINITIKEDLYDIETFISDNYIEMFYMNTKGEFFLERFDINTGKLIKKGKIDIDLKEDEPTNLLIDDEYMYVLDSVYSYKEDQTRYNIKVIDKITNELAYEGDIKSGSKLMIGMEER